MSQGEKDSPFASCDVHDRVALKTDHKDWGPMGDMDDPRKPDCGCSYSMVMSTGRNGDWTWECMNCRRYSWWPDGTLRSDSRLGR